MITTTVKSIRRNEGDQTVHFVLSDGDQDYPWMADVPLDVEDVQAYIATRKQEYAWDILRKRYADPDLPVFESLGAMVAWIRMGGPNHIAVFDSDGVQVGERVITPKPTGHKIPDPVNTKLSDLGLSRLANKTVPQVQTYFDNNAGDQVVYNDALVEVALTMVLLLNLLDKKLHFTEEDD